MPHGIIHLILGASFLLPLVSHSHLSELAALTVWMTSVKVSGVAGGKHDSLVLSPPPGWQP